jgi:hypothetical protein
MPEMNTYQFIPLLSRDNSYWTLPLSKIKLDNKSLNHCARQEGSGAAGLPEGVEEV